MSLTGDDNAMTQCPRSREIDFDAVFNFRDIGGYRTADGRTVAWRRVFRSAQLGNMTVNDLSRMKSELGIRSVLDFRDKAEVDKQGIGLISGSGLEYHHVPLVPADRGEPDPQVLRSLRHMGDLYLLLAKNHEFGRRLVEAMDLVSVTSNCPLVFSCAIGKDRTGIMAALLLSLLKVGEEDIVNDYCMSASYSATLKSRARANPSADSQIAKLPDLVWEASHQSMEFFLAKVSDEYGSPRRYMERHGAESSLFERLESTLLADSDP